VAVTGEKRNVYMELVPNPERKKQLGRLCEGEKVSEISL
jgi:hypothetical protein